MSAGESFLHFKSDCNLVLKSNLESVYLGAACTDLGLMSVSVHCTIVGGD